MSILGKDLMSGTALLTIFGTSIRSFRKRLGISQEELAGRADLHRTYIAGIERGGRNLTLKSMERLASALQVSLEELIREGAVPSQQVAEERGRHADLVDLLLVEDSQDDIALTLEAFKEFKFANEVNVVRDGAEAFDYLWRAGRYASRGGKLLPDVVLLDLHLPKMGGREVLRRLKANELTRRIPVVVLTVSDDQGDITECQRLGAATYIVKPVNFQNFSRATPQLQLHWALVKPDGRKPSGMS